VIGGIPFTIPSQFMAAHATGQIVRYGAVLKDAHTGRIVAHLQETGLLQRAVGTGLSFDPSGASGLIGVVQNAQISQKITQLQSAVGVVQNLQLVNLVSSVAGIGVTAASTAIILGRLNAIGDRIGRLEQGVEALPGVFRKLELRNTMIEIGTALERFESADNRRDKDQTVRAVEEKLHYGFDRMLDGVRTTAETPGVDAEAIRCLLASLSVCGAAQIKAFLWLNEREMAAGQARRQFVKLMELSEMFPKDVLMDRLDCEADDADRLEADLAGLRQRFAAIPSLVENLIALDLDGRDYLERLDAERDHPLLVLPASAAA